MYLCLWKLDLNVQERKIRVWWNYWVDLIANWVTHPLIQKAVLRLHWSPTIAKTLTRLKQEDFHDSKNAIKTFQFIEIFLNLRCCHLKTVEALSEIDFSKWTAPTDPSRVANDPVIRDCNGHQSLKCFLAINPHIRDRVVYLNKRLLS